MTVAVVTFVWRGEREYGPDHVNLLARQLRARMTCPYRFVAITDEGGNYDSDVEVIPTPRTARTIGRVRTPEASRFPSCYRRLWLFSDEAKELADRVLMTDVDAVAVADWAPLFDHDHDFIGWFRPKGSWGSVERRLGGGTWMLTTGTHTHVWNDFVCNPARAIQAARNAGYRGSDQAWISYCLANTAPVWPDSMGIYSVRDFTGDNRAKRVPSIPDNARIVHFNGLIKPWEERAREQHPWLANVLP